MNLEKMKYFASVVEYMSFSKAAEQHYISQAAMSQQINSLENELGVKLIHRSHVQISLTEEGKIFYEESKKILRQYNGALEKLSTFQKDKQSIFNVGYSSAFEKDLLVGASKRIEEHGIPKLRFYYFQLPELKHALMDGHLELILTFDTEFPPVIEKKIISVSEFLIGVSPTHRLAGETSIDAKEIMNEKIIMFVDVENGRIPDSMIKHCREDGYEPNIVETVSSMETLELLVQLNRGIAFFPNTPHYIYNDNIHFIRLKNTHHKLDVCAAWKKDNQLPYLKQFIKVLEENKNK